MSGEAALQPLCSGFASLPNAQEDEALRVSCQNRQPHAVFEIMPAELAAKIGSVYDFRALHLDDHVAGAQPGLGGGSEGLGGGHHHGAGIDLVAQLTRDLVVQGAPSLRRGPESSRRGDLAPPSPPRSGSPSLS